MKPRVNGATPAATSSCCLNSTKYELYGPVKQQATYSGVTLQQLLTNFFAFSEFCCIGQFFGVAEASKPPEPCSYAAGTYLTYLDESSTMTNVSTFRADDARRSRPAVRLTAVELDDANTVDSSVDDRRFCICICRLTSYGHFRSVQVDVGCYCTSSSFDKICRPGCWHDKDLAM